MGGYTSKCDKKSKSLHPDVQSVSHWSSCPELGAVETPAVAVPAAPGCGWCVGEAMSRLGADRPFSVEG
jgi:hypothetical protein